MSWLATDATSTALASLRQEISDIEAMVSRAGASTRAAVAVMLAVTVTLWLRVDAPWWAGISAFVSLQATAPASMQRGLLRISGTVLGAAIAVLLAPWLIEDQVAISLALFLAGTLGVLGLQVSSHGYAWLLGAITANMVLLATLGDPATTLTVACNRVAEVTIGTAAAVLVSLLFSPEADAALAKPAPGWGDVFGAQWPSTQHALRAGASVMLVPWIWNWLALPSLSQTAITVAAVMAVPAISQDEAENRHKLTARAIHRLLGCLFGGVAGLVLLAFSFESFVPWLVSLGIGIWLCAHLQNSTRDIGYVGIQAAVVLILTLVQGAGPPSAIAGGLERFAGITGGLLILLVVAIVTAPAPARTAAA
jgi:uncharacterized membrane protein YccC